MNFTDRNITIGEIAAELPESVKVFKAYQIDFCCGGNRKLTEVIKEQGINKTELFNKLHYVQFERNNNSSDKTPNRLNGHELADYIEATHHLYLRSVLPKIAELSNAVLRAHGKKHKELFRVYSLLACLKGDLEQHLIKEESFLFPAFLNEDKYSGAITELTADIVKEHEETKDLLSQLRNTTDNYEIPDDACISYQKLYEMLQAMDEDLHRHIHLENNVLLKKYDMRQKNNV